MGAIKVNEDAFLKISKRKKILEEGKGHFTGYPSIDMPWLKYYTEEQILSPIPYSMSAFDYLYFSNNNNLNNIAIEFRGEKITYMELFQRIFQTAKALLNLGVKQGEIVTIMLPACPEETFLFYALDIIGACSNYLFLGTPLEEAKQNMELLNSTKLIVLEDLLYQPNTIINNDNYKIIVQPTMAKIDGLNVEQWDKFMENGKDTELIRYVRGDEEPLFIAKTGGSTGKPKNVVLSDRGFNLQVHQHLNTSQRYDIGDKWLRPWPLFSASAAVASNHLPLCAGMHMIVEDQFSVEKIDELILKHKPSHMPLIASAIDVLINSKVIQEQGIPFMKSLGVGGAPMTEETEIKADKFLSENNVEEHIRVGYGMTENSSGAASCFNNETTAFGGTGVPQLNTIISIFEPDTDIEKKYGEVGEVCVLSSTFMLGYYNDTEATNAVLRKHSDGNIWLHSGDLGYMNDDGQLFIKGRIKRVIALYNGHKIYPLDMESMIETLDEVQKAVIIPEEDLEHPGFVRPCCFITPTADISSEELINKINNECLKGMPDYAKIASVYIKYEMPKTAIGKIDLPKLEEEAKMLVKIKH